MLNRGLLALVYSLTLILGVLTLRFPAPSIEGVIGLYFTYIYAGFLVIGSVGCLIGIAKPNYRIELGFLWPVAGGYLMYAIALWALLIDRLDELTLDIAAPFGPAIVTTVLAIFLFAKILMLRKKNKQLVEAVTNDRLD